MVKKVKKEKRYKLIYEKDQCIGAGACVMSCPQHWELDKEGKATLKGAKKNKEVFELEIREEDYKKMLEAAKACPANCIHIIDKKTGKKII